MGSVIGLCDIMMSIVWCWCYHDTVVDVLATLTTKISWQLGGRYLHCGDPHCNIQQYNIGNVCFGTEIILRDHFVQ